MQRNWKSSKRRKKEGDSGGGISFLEVGRARSGPRHRARRSARPVAAEPDCREAAVPHGYQKRKNMCMKN